MESSAYHYHRFNDEDVNITENYISNNMTSSNKFNQYNQYNQSSQYNQYNQNYQNYQNSQYQNQYQSDQDYMNNNNNNNYTSQNQPPNQNSRHSVTSSSYSYQNFNPKFSPHEKNTKLKWRDLMKLDLSYIKTPSDLSIFDPYLKNLLFSKVSNDEIGSLPERNVQKLLQIYQFLLESLYNVNKNYCEDYNSLKEEYNALEMDSKSNDEIIKKNMKVINQLKKERKNNEIVLSSYKNSLEFLRNSNVIKNDININSSLRDAFCANGYACKYCAGKRFSTKEKLLSHLSTRHLIHEIPKDVKNQIKNNENNVEKKIDGLKKELNDYIKGNQGNDLIEFIEMSNKMEDEMTNKKINKLQRDFQMSLNELKDLYLQHAKNNSEMYQFRPNIIIPQGVNLQSPPVDPNPNPPIIPNNDMIKEEIAKMNQTLTELMKQQDKSNKDNLDLIRNSMDLNRKNFAEMNDSMSKQINYNNELFKNTMSSMNKGLINTKNVVVNEKKVVNLIVDDQEKNLNSGRFIESDHDDSDLERENNKKVIKEFKNVSEVFKVVNERKVINNVNVNMESKGGRKDVGIKKENDDGQNNQMNIKINLFDHRKKNNDDDDGEGSVNINDDYNNIQLNSNPMELLNDFYKRYNEREKVINKEKNIDCFGLKILPKSYILKDIQKTSALSNSKLITKKNVFNNINLDNLDNEPKDNLITIIKTSKDNIDNINKGNKEKNDIYLQITDALKFGSYDEATQKIIQEDELYKTKQIMSELAVSHDDVIPEANISTSKIKAKISSNRREDNGDEEFNLQIEDV